MNVYDVVNDLTKAIKGSHEFKALQEAHAKLKLDADAEKLAQDFLKQKQELEIAQYTGKTPSKEENEKVQKLYEVLALNPVAMDYLQAYIRFQMMVGDISKSIGDVVKEAVEG